MDGLVLGRRVPPLTLVLQRGASFAAKLDYRDEAGNPVVVPPGQSFELRIGSTVWEAQVQTTSDATWIVWDKTVDEVEAMFEVYRAGDPARLWKVTGAGREVPWFSGAVVVDVGP